MLKGTRAIVLVFVALFAATTTTFACTDCEGHKSVSREVWLIETPANQVFTGNAVFYAPGRMQEVIATREGQKNTLEVQQKLARWHDGYYLGAVSAMSPSDMWKEIWIKRDGTSSWEGPYLVVDCAQQSHIYRAINTVGEIVEVDYETAERWGMVVSDANGNWIGTQKWSAPISVYIGNRPPNKKLNTINYRSWWLNQWN